MWVVILNVWVFGKGYFGDAGNKRAVNSLHYFGQGKGIGSGGDDAELGFIHYQHLALPGRVHIGVGWHYLRFTNRYLFEFTFINQYDLWLCHAVFGYYIAVCFYYPWCKGVLIGLVLLVVTSRNN